MPVDGAQYPVHLSLQGRPVLVVGGGSVATRKVHGLIAGGADVITVVAPEPSAELVALAESGALALERRSYRAAEAAAYRLVLTATDDPAANRAVFEDAERAGVWVNAADEPASCSFTLPASVRQGRLLVSIGTGGHSPAMAAWLRARFEAEFGPEYDAALELLSAERESRKAEGRSTEGLDWQRALDNGLLDLLRTNQIERARELLRTCLSSSSG